MEEEGEENDEGRNEGRDRVLPPMVGGESGGRVSYDSRGHSVVLLKLL